MKRKTLITMFGALALFGLILLAVPFIQSMRPADHINNASLLNVDISAIEPGTYKRIYWLGSPIAVYRPDDEAFEYLESVNDDVWGPVINQSNRSLFYIYLPISTYLGCAVKDTRTNPYFHEQVPKGWYDPCHMGAWDYAGRTFKEVYVPKDMKLPNLKEPKYRMLTDNEIQLYK